MTGSVKRYRGRPQIDVRAISRIAGADPADFLPRSWQDLDQLDGFLEHLAREVHDQALAGLLAAFLEEEALRGAWRRAPCVPNDHHGYRGGLLEHTVGVAALAHDACQLHSRLDADLLLTAET